MVLTNISAHFIKDLDVSLFKLSVLSFFMVRIKKVKSGKKFYYYWVKDIYDSNIQRSSTVVVRKATKEEIEKFEKGEYQEVPEIKDKTVKYELNIIFQDDEKEIIEYTSYKILLRGIKNKVKELEAKKKIKSMEIIPKY